MKNQSMCCVQCKHGDGIDNNKSSWIKEWKIIAATK